MFDGDAEDECGETGALEKKFGRKTNIWVSNDHFKKRPNICLLTNICLPGTNICHYGDKYMTPRGQISVLQSNICPSWGKYLPFWRQIFVPERQKSGNLSPPPDKAQSGYISSKYLAKNRQIFVTQMTTICRINSQIHIQGQIFGCFLANICRIGTK